MTRSQLMIPQITSSETGLIYFSFVLSADISDSQLDLAVLPNRTWSRSEKEFIRWNNELFITTKQRGEFKWLRSVFLLYHALLNSVIRYCCRSTWHWDTQCFRLIQHHREVYFTFRRFATLNWRNLKKNARLIQESTEKRRAMRKMKCDRWVTTEFLHPQ